MRRLLAVGGLAVLLATAPELQAAKRTKVVESTVALVGDRPILVSELRQRMTFAPGERAPRMLERLIEERLIELEADELRITVTVEEVDEGVAAARAAGRIAGPGMSEQDFRDEIRRQRTARSSRRTPQARACAPSRSAASPRR